MVDRNSWLPLVMVIILAACNSCRQSPSDNAPKPGPNAVAEPLTTPPFQTKEPSKYQATVEITVSFVGGQGVPMGGPLNKTTQFVARDGDKKRLEFELLPGKKVINLITPAGEFVLYPAEKVYVEVRPEKLPAGKTAAGDESLEEFSPEKLLNPQLPGAKYQKIGAEEVNGRTTTKYSSAITATINGKTNVTETFIWVDDALGIPVKEESSSSAEGTRRTLEYRNIKTEVEATLFDIPPGYRKVTQQQLQQRVSPDAAQLSGSDRDELPHDETHANP